jgi:hypothetical protein
VRGGDHGAGHWRHTDTEALMEMVRVASHVPPDCLPASTLTDTSPRCFWINLPLGVPPIIIMALFFSDPQESPAKNMTWSAIVKQLDLLGTVAFVPAITCLFLALSWAGTKYDFDSPIVLCLYAAFALLLALFIWDQYRKQDAATLPPRIFKQRSIVAGVSNPLSTIPS